MTWKKKLGLQLQKYLVLILKCNTGCVSVIRSLIIKFLLKTCSVRSATRVMCFRHIWFDRMRFKLTDILRRKDLEVNVKVTMAVSMIS
jgi:hypothetical protein